MGLPGGACLRNVIRSETEVIYHFRLTKEELAEIAKPDKGERNYHRTDEQLAGFAAWRPSFETK